MHRCVCELRFAEHLGADRVVLGRELSIKEIASVAADLGDLEVEARMFFLLFSHLSKFYRAYPV